MRGKDRSGFKPVQVLHQKKFTLHLKFNHSAFLAFFAAHTNMRRNIMSMPSSHIPQPQPTAATDPDIERLDQLAKLLDNQFRIPGTQVRFGLDAIIGLVPYVGDIAGFVVSGFLLRTMVKKGAGPIIMLRMMANYVIDTLVGIVPFLGDLFDIGFKANRRNVALLKAYYAEDPTRMSIKWTLLLFALVFMAMLGFVMWLIWRFAALVTAWLWQLAFGG
jgi:hypothetical protein